MNDIKTHSMDIKTQVKNAFENFESKGKLWALMLFNTELELGISNSPGKWVNTGNAFYKDGVSALNAYSNTQNPASQLIDAKTTEELELKMEEMLHNYKNEKWLENNLYPFL